MRWHSFGERGEEENQAFVMVYVEEEGPALASAIQSLIASLPLIVLQGINVRMEQVRPASVCWLWWRDMRDV